MSLTRALKCGVCNGHNMATANPPLASTLLPKRGVGFTSLDRWRPSFESAAARTRGDFAQQRIHVSRPPGVFEPASSTRYCYRFR